MRTLLLMLSLLTVPCGSIAHSEVLDSADNGFSLKHKVTIKTTPEKVYETIIKPSLWWNSSHRWSGKSENLSIETTPGGLFLEKLPSGGFVRHMEVIYADPGKMLRMHGALGPLQQTACHGTLTFTLTPEKDATIVEVTYTVSGYVSGGLKTWSAPVNQVIVEQVDRLKKAVEAP